MKNYFRAYRARIREAYLATLQRLYHRHFPPAFTGKVDRVEAVLVFSLEERTALKLRFPEDYIKAKVVNKLLEALRDRVTVTEEKDPARPYTVFRATLYVVTPEEPEKVRVPR